jgi:hypothetical protein
MTTFRGRPAGRRVPPATGRGSSSLLRGRLDLRGAPVDRVREPRMEVL